MSSLRRPKAATLVALAFSVVALLAAGAGTAAAGTGGHASPDTTGDYISLTSVSSPNNAQGDLSVDLQSTSAITTVSVHIYDSTGSTDLLDPAVAETSSTPASLSDPGQSTWTVTTPIAQTQLPLGEHLVVVDATDSGGTAIKGLNQDWYFIAIPQVTISASNTDITLTDPTSTISGAVSLVAPDGTATPYVGQVIVDMDWGYGQETATTNSDGGYSFTVSPTAAESSAPQLAVELPDGIPGQTVGSPAVTFKVTVDPTKITALLSSPTVNYGTKVTLSGAIMYQPDALGLIRASYHAHDG